MMLCSQRCRTLFAAMLFLYALLASFPVLAETNTAETTEPTYPEVFTQPATPAAVNTPTSNRQSVGAGVVNADPVTAIAGLILVVFLILTIAWLIRRVGGVPMMGGQAMKVSAVLSIGTREKVVLVDVGDKQILLGVAPGRVTHLESFDEPVISQTATSAAQGDFSATIKNLLQKNNPGGQS